jgi:hypothetical protein
MLAKTAYWLSIPQNQGLDQWEEVFLSYAETEIQVIDLMNTMLAKLQPRHRTQMVSVLQTYGEELESRFEELMDPVDACGDLWHTTAKWHYGSHAKQLPRKKQYGWEDMNIGSVQSISITSRNGRIWTARWDGNHELMTGQAGQMHSFNNLNGCIDVCLVPFAEKGADLLLVTAAGRNPNTGTALWVNEWHDSTPRMNWKGTPKRVLRQDGGSRKSSAQVASLWLVCSATLPDMNNLYILSEGKSRRMAVTPTRSPTRRWKGCSGAIRTRLIPTR